MALDSVKVLGLDLAAAHSGVCLVEAKPSLGYPAISVDVLEHFPIELNKSDDFLIRSIASHELMDIAEDATFVVVEDYVRAMGNNTTAYEHAELSGITKYILFHMLHKPIMVIPPTTMRAFVKIPPKQKDKGKGYIINQAEALYGFKARAPRKAQRSNMADAFMHCVIGSHLYFAKTGQLHGELAPHEERIIYGTDKFSGLVERDNVLYDPTGELYG